VLIISCSQIDTGATGLLLYSIAGPNSIPFRGGVLCMNTPVYRTPRQDSRGSGIPTCSGRFAIDMNAFGRGLLGGNPIPALRVIGTMVQCQWWARDPAFAGSSIPVLSDAIEYIICQ
jgi:hypothetical protein